MTVPVVRVRTLAVAVLAFASSSSAAPDDPPLLVVPLPPPAPVSANAPGATVARLGMPHLALDARGNVLLSWVESRGEHAGTLAFARLDAAVEEWSAPQRIASGDDWFVNWADFPSIAALPDGTLIAHWLRMLGEDTFAYGAEFVLSADDGSTWSEPRLLHTNDAPVEHGFVSIVALPNAPGAISRFGAVWLDGRATDVPEGASAEARGPMQLFFRTISRTGELGDETRLDERCCDCCPTSIASTSAGELIAVYRDRTADEIRDISIVRRAAPTVAGARPTWTAPVPLARDGWETPGCPVNGPRLAVDGERVAAAWYTGAGGGAGRVLVAVRPAGAQSFAPPRGIDDGAPVGRVDATFHEGELYVAWLEVDEGRTSWRARVLPAAGPPSESVVIAEVPMGRASGHVRLVADRTSVVAAWTDPASGRVHAARLVRSE